MNPGFCWWFNDQQGSIVVPFWNVILEWLIGFYLLWPIQLTRHSVIWLDSRRTGPTEDLLSLKTNLSSLKRSHIQRLISRVGPAFYVQSIVQNSGRRSTTKTTITTTWELKMKLCWSEIVVVWNNNSTRVLKSELPICCGVGHSLNINLSASSTD